MRILIPLLVVPGLVAIFALGCQANGGRDVASTTNPADHDRPIVSAQTQEPTPAQDQSTVRPTQDPKSDSRPSANAQDDPRIDKLVKVSGPLIGVDVAAHAFPPVVPDTAQHKDAWWRNDCLRCHETGVADAPKLIHRDLPLILLTAKCRTCHVQVKGAKPRVQPVVDTGFDANAFPPQIPASVSHPDVWLRDDCLLCHDSGLRGAPIVKHHGMSKLLLLSKCRTCHVQVRAVQFRRVPQR